MRLALCGTALLLAGCAGEPHLVVNLHYDGFRPGCLVLLATPEGAAAPRMVELLLSSPERAGDRAIAVFAPKGQGPRISLEAQAREQRCDGPVVARAQAEGLASTNGTPVPISLSASDPDDDGFISTLATLPGTDCLEGDADAHPRSGGEIACDGVDDDCAGGVDDTFNVGQACGSGSCTGVLVCAGSGDVRCNAAVADWYQDRDGDDAGGQFVGSFCGPDAGLAGAGGDCDDDDRYVYPGAPEICDGKDTNCDGNPQDTATGSCGRSSLPPGTNLLAVHTPVPGRAWVTGVDGGLFVLSADGGVTNRSEICGIHDWRGIWVDRQDRPYLIAPQARVAYAYDAGMGACLTSSVGGATQVNGVWGYPLPDGGTQAFMVTSNAHIKYWAPPAAPTQLFQVGSGSDNMRALDGVASYPRIAAGWYFDGTLHPRVWIDSGGGFAEQGAEALLGTGIPLFGAKMPRADLAYACGDQGSVLAFEGGTWTKLPPPTPELPDLTSITAFDETHVYVSGFGSDAAWVWAWDGASWTPVLRVPPDAGSIRALGGTGPDDLWVVGRDNAWRLSLP